MGFFATALLCIATAVISQLIAARAGMHHSALGERSLNVLGCRDQRRLACGNCGKTWSEPSRARRCYTHAMPQSNHRRKE